MGRSDYGGASNMGANADVGSNFGGNHPLATPVLGKQISSGTNEGLGGGMGGGPRSSGSRRRQVLERNNLNSGGQSAAVEVRKSTGDSSGRFGGGTAASGNSRER